MRWRGTEAPPCSVGLGRNSLPNKLCWHCPQCFGQRLCGRLELPSNSMKDSSILGGGHEGRCACLEAERLFLLPLLWRTPAEQWQWCNLRWHRRIASEDKGCASWQVVGFGWHNSCV